MANEFSAGDSNRASRRIFLKCGMGACAASAIIPRLSGQAPLVPFYKAVFDERFAEARAFAAAAAERRIPAAAIRGDITRLFFDDLDLRWKRGPVRLAGYTTPSSLFCLDLLARDRGMRLSHCVANPSLQAALGLLDGVLPRTGMTTHWPPTDPSALVFWIVTPSARASSTVTADAPLTARVDARPRRVADRPRKRAQ